MVPRALRGLAVARAQAVRRARVVPRVRVALRVPRALGVALKCSGILTVMAMVMGATAGR